MRPGAEVDHPSAEGEDPFELLDSAIDVEQREQRRRVDPVVVRVAPVLLQPLVEGADCQEGQLGIGAHAVLDAHGGGREQDHGVEALLIHEGEARGAVLERRIDGNGGVRLGDAPRLEGSKHLPEAARRSDALGVEGFSQEREPVVAEPDVRSTPFVEGEAHPAVLQRSRQVAGERVDRLVVVVVSVDEDGRGAHAIAPRSLSRTAKRPSRRELTSAATPAPTSAR